MDDLFCSGVCGYCQQSITWMIFKQESYDI